jgi:predicted amidohydrolase
MNVGFAQFAPVLGDLEANVALVQRLAPSFADADLVVLPELANSGYNFPDRATALACAEDPRDSPFVAALIEQARAADQHLVTGFCERVGDRLYNTALLLGPAGLVGAYRKLHLFLDEKDIFEPGDLGLPIFDLPQARVGMLVCFDWVFPEAWRVLALQGAEIICHPANLVLPGKCQSVVPAQALCNRVFVITANRIGQEGELTFTGDSLICGPDGALLARAPADIESVCLVEVEIAAARDKFVTRRNHIFADRRPDEYAILTSRRTAE